MHSNAISNEINTPGSLICDIREDHDENIFFEIHPINFVSSLTKALNGNVSTMMYLFREMNV